MNSKPDAITPDEPARRQFVDRPALVFLGQIVVIAAILVLWEVATDLHWLDPFFFSKPSAIGTFLVQIVQSRNFVENVTTTLVEAAVGLALGGGAGLVFGFVIGRSRLLFKLLDPIISALNTLPRVALAPLFILWFGIGEEAKIALVISVVFFIMLLNTFAAVVSVDTDLEDALRLAGAKRWLMFRRLYLPSSLPYLMAGLRISLAFAVSAAIVGEMLVSKFGLGQMLRQRQDMLDTAGTFGVLVIIAILAIILNGIIKVIEVSLTRWRPRNALSRPEEMV